jgi:hypothetical protein
VICMKHLTVGRMARTRIRRGAALTAAWVLASAGVALAAHAVAGASYENTASSTGKISFKVSSNGRTVTHLDVSTPVHCAGGCGGIASPSGGSARIRKNKFTVTLPLYFPPGSHSSEGTDMVTGRFLAGGKATGTISSHFKHSSSSDRTVNWTATG